jgi:4-hydroxy-tetrahydrodipicolinate synthase
MTAFPRVLTALATPMTADGAVDLDGVQRLAAHVVDTGSEGIVATGTTGESPTLTHGETLDVFRAVVDAVGDRATVLAGCGKNDTAATVELVREASTLGVDGILSVTGYYNKPNQRGLDAHFRAVAGATDLPVMIYNIPARTANEIAPETLLGLAERVPNVAGVKDAVGDLVKMGWLAARAPEGFAIWSGDDALLLPALSVGAVGVVSVAAHLVGNDIAALVEAFPTDPAKAREVAFRIAPLCAALFAEPSPAPLKAGLALLGLPAGPVRLPLVQVTDATRDLVRDALLTAGVTLEETPASAAR